MEEKELIRQLQKLKQIKPNQNWAVLTKSRILGEEEAEQQKVKLGFLPWFNILRFTPLPRGVLGPALAFSTLTIVVAFAVWTWGSLPGDTLYPVRKAAQQTSLITKDPASFSLDLAADSARALKQIAQSNEVEKLAPAMKEYEENIKKATASLDASPQNGDNVLKIAEKVNQIEQEAKEIEQILQTEIAKQEREELAKKARAVVSAELEEVRGQIAQIVQEHISDLEGVSLTDEQEGLLQEAKDAFENGEYELALEIIIELSNQ